MRVLLVDDEEELVVTLAERLEIRDIDADFATTSERALRLVAEREYEVAVLDVKIPKISGIELKKQMQEIRPEMAFVFVTGHGSQADFEEGVEEAGAGNYLVKPINIERLIAKMHQVVSGK